MSPGGLPVDGMTAVAARIGEIRALLHPAPVQAAAPVAGAAGGFPSVGAGLAPAGPEFADALARAVAPAGAKSLSVAELKAKFSNGRLPADALASVGDGGHRLAAPAAAAFSDLQAAAQRDGVTVGVTDSYRSFGGQVDVARRKGLYSQGGLAAQPGTSQHGWGLAVDLCGGVQDFGSAAHAWMRAQAPAFGWVHPAWARADGSKPEAWHWEFGARS